ncbi:MAG: VOC family protein [Micrococcales bacterium]|nr:VOC family protein [Micrococcales bacterium]
MALSVGCITFDSRDPRALAAWWAKALDGEIVSDMDGFYVTIMPGGEASLPLSFQLIEDPTPGKNRIHLETTASDGREAEVDRLVKLGASVVYQGDMGGFAWTTLADPDGNLFCVGDPMEMES